MLGEAGIYRTFYRTYDPVLGRFQGIDPLASQTPDWSPYQFALGNPLTANDPTGALTQEEFDTIINTLTRSLNEHRGDSGGGDSFIASWSVTSGYQGVSSVMNINGAWGYYSFASSSNYDKSLNTDGSINVGQVTLTATFTPLPTPTQIGLYFNSGFTNNDNPSDEFANSGLINLFGIEQASVDLAIKRSIATATSFSEKRTIANALKISSKVGKLTGSVSAAFAIIENARDKNGLTYGDVAKISLGLAFTFVPPLAIAGLGFAVADITVRFVTGTSISDRLGAGIDSAIQSRGYNPTVVSRFATQ